MKVSLKGVAKILNQGGIGVMPTDTIYGLVGSALEPETVRRIYKVRKRNPRKPSIILIGSANNLNLFGIKVDSREKKILSKLWPGKVSVILPCQAKKFQYLHRGTKTLAFRLPKKPSLVRLLKKTGPLVAPSANFEGMPPSLTIKEARKYFGEKIDFYVDGGRASSKPSTLVQINRNKLIIIRFGAFKIPQKLINNGYL